MNDAGLSQRNRLLVLFIDIGILSFVSWKALGQWFPPVGVKGFWFYVAILSLLLGFRLITPFYVKPVDAISYAIPAVVALFLVNDWNAWAKDERLLFVLAVIYCSLIGIISFISILSKDSNNEAVRRLSNGMRISVATLGVPQAIFSVLILFAIYTFHRESTTEILWIGLAWIMTVATQPADVVIGLFNKLKNLWKGGHASQIVGTVMAYQNPGVILIRQSDAQSISFGTSLLIRDPHAPDKIALTLDYVGRDEGIILRAIELKATTYSDKAAKTLKGLPNNAAVALEKNEVESSDDKARAILEELDSLVGIVATETSVERLFFEVIQEEDLREGSLVETFVGKQPVLYQVINGLTKEEIVHKKNTVGFIKAQAQKIGVWSVEEKKFEIVKWLPQLNTPVFIKTSGEGIFDLEAIGNFPRTDYPVRIENINELVTHNSAILGILGVGKSMLALELVERMIAEGIKVICLDLTDEYPAELSQFYSTALEQEALEGLMGIGRAGKTKVSRNVEEGGAVIDFAAEMEKYLKEFLQSDTGRRVLIFNPSNFEIWKQDSKPFNNEASMASLTPTEVTQIITEATLRITQRMGKTEDGKARVCLVYEEAHTLIPEWSAVAADGDKSATNGTARAILQGRKFGLGCIIISQRTANVTKTILNQCNTLFALRSFDDSGGRVFLTEKRAL